MKVCLIFTPFGSFSMVPLGISYLKSFILKNLHGVRVKNIDLSNNFYHNLTNTEFLCNITNLCEECSKLNNMTECQGILKKLNDGKITHGEIVFASKSLISRFRSRAFYDPNKYNQVLVAYNDVYYALIRCINKYLAAYLTLDHRDYNSILQKKLIYNDLSVILKQNPDVVGLSIFQSEQLKYSLALAQGLKKIKKDLKIVFGGAYISHLDAKVLLQMFDFIDFIVHKEGELALTELLKNLKTKKFNRVPSLIYRSSNRILQNKTSVVHELNNIPFPDHKDFNLKKYYTPTPVVSTLFSRGCPWGGCTYCTLNKSFAKPYRTRSVKNFIKELQNYRKKGIKNLYFSDEMITASDLGRICEIIIKRKIKMNFLTMVKPTGDFTEEIFEKMNKAGFKMLIWGVESFSQRVLDAMNKGTNSQEIQKVLKRASERKLKNTVFLIHHFPTQTEKEMLQDYKYLKKNAKYIDYAVVHEFCLEEGSPISYNLNKFGLKNCKKSPLLKTNRGVLLHPNLLYHKQVDYDRVHKLKRGLIKKSKELQRIFKPLYNQAWYYGIEHILLHSSNKPILSTDASKGQRRILKVFRKDG